MEILLIGNTDFVTKQWIEHTFPQDKVVVALRKGTESSGEDLKIIDMPDRDAVSEVFSNYEFDRIVYFSEDLTPRSERDGDLGYLRRLLHTVRNRKVQMLMVSGPESEFAYPQETDVHETSKSLMSRAGEELGLYYARTYDLEVKIVRCPYLYAPQRNGVTAYFNGLFEQAQAGELRFHERAEQRTCFLCADDLAELIYRIFDDWTADGELFHVPNVFDFTYGDLGTLIAGYFPGTKVVYGEDRPQAYPADDHELRLRYGFSPRYSLREDFPHVIEGWLKLRENKTDKYPVWDFLRSHNKWWTVLEIIGAFLLTEWLRTFTQGNSQLETVDLRLLFVVIVGTIYGLHAGVFAAVLACAGVAMSYASQGASFAPLFYDTSNWLAFVIYFVAGSVCGYVQSRNQESVRFVRDENGLLRNRLDFLRGLYQDVLDDRRQLRDQIIGRRDSFGKLYAVTRELDEVQPQKLYHTAIRIMQESLDSDSLAIFRVDNGGQFARLVAASPRFDVGSFRSVRVSDYGEIITALEHNGIWVNRTLKDKFPMYAVGVRDRGELAVIITMGEAKPDQMNLYFQNLFSIMCGLVESAMIRAFEYEDVARAYFGDDNIYRIGGDEFVIISFAHSMAQSARQMGYMRQELLDHGCELSVGMAESDDGEDIPDLVNQAENEMCKDKKRYYASGSGKRQLRTLNKQLEDILVRNKDMESLLQHLNTRYSIAYVVNLRADTQRPVVVPGYVQKMLDKHGGSFHEMLLDYCDKLVAPAYRDGFRMLFDYDYVRDRICREGAIRYAYVRNDGERFLITIFPDTHSVDEVMWVFAKEDTSSEE